MLLLVACTSAYAQTTTSLVITITDEGVPKAGVTVTAIGEHDATFTATTNEQGDATLTLPPGTYFITVEGDPMHRRREVTVTLGQAARFHLDLAPTATMALPPEPQQPPPHTFPEIPPDVDRSAENYAVVRVYYATNRAYTGETKPAKLYGAARGNLRFGIARVSIPREHKIGELEAPSITTLEFREDPSRHVVLLSVQPQRVADFYAKLRNSVDRSRNRETFVFIHGYNVTFEDATRRTAQIKYDLAFDGPAILFTWPSWGKTTEYPADGRNADWAAADLKTFLSDLAQRSGATKVHLIAHSMGNRVLAGALAKLDPGAHAPFDQIVLAAPDLDADVFKRDLAPQYLRLANHVTLYASSKDEALAAGKKFDRAPRLGDATAGVVVIPSMDTIDVSDVDTSFLGHSYVGDNSTVLSDLYCLIRGATAAAARCRLSAVGDHWKFVPTHEAIASLASYQCSAEECRLRR